MKITILGTRGIPANHGGFETFAEKLALYLVAKKWDVTVYCQGSLGEKPGVDFWNGVRLVHVPISREDALGTILFDLKSTWMASKEGGLLLTLGYNTAAFSFLYRLKGIKNLMNMDGIEWKRQKWSLPQKIWLYLNERLGCWFADHLIADHPIIADHLATRVSREKISVITYGGNPVTNADPEFIKSFGLAPGGYALVIARPNIDNSILEIVTAFSSRQRHLRLVVLGDYDAEASPYHRQVLEAAGPEVLFAGGIYEKPKVEALRFFAKLFIHGNRIGGTSPTLVESLAVGNPVLSYDSALNRWVAGEGALYFTDGADCEKKLSQLLDNGELLAKMGRASRERFHAEFSWDKVLGSYEELLTRWQ